MSHHGGRAGAQEGIKEGKREDQHSPLSNNCHLKNRAHNHQHVYNLDVKKMKRAQSRPKQEVEFLNGWIFGSICRRKQMEAHSLLHQKGGGKSSTFQPELFSLVLAVAHLRVFNSDGHHHLSLPWAGETLEGF